MNRFLWPLALFIVLAGFLAFGLNLDPRAVPSPLIGKPAPSFSAAVLDQPDRQVTLADMAGKVWILNVWASWCAPCREEHPLWVAYARQSGAPPIVGLNYKDQTVAARKWLAQLGDPYTLSLVDADGRIGIDFGVYGVPETFVIDGQGLIRLKHVGPITSEVLRGKIMPLLKALNG